MSVFAPLIIIGMHRSGTSLLCDMLGELGVFFGQDRTVVNRESSFFVEINRWLFEQCGATWDRPLAVRELFTHEALCNEVSKQVCNILRSSYASQYLGGSARNGFFSIDRAWGWKDPRTTFTLSLWTELFPNARILHVYRNGVDVAQSLKKREEAFLEKKRQAVSRSRILMCREFLQRQLDHRKMLRLTMSLRCLSLDGGFSLWEEYMTEARSQVAIHQERSMEVRYEELLADPGRLLKNMCDFSGVTVGNEVLAKVAAGVRSERANAFTHDPNLRAFYESRREQLAKYGY